MRIWPIVAIGGLLATGAAGAAAPGPNGLIAYSRCCPASIVAVRADGNGSRVLLRAAHDDAPLGPAWSRDGRRIAYAPGVPERGIWSMDSAGRNRRRVTAGNGGAVHPSWSPLGRRLVFADLRARGSRTYDLFVVGADGRGLKRLTGTAAAEDSPAWAPNGNEIVYNRGRDLWRMRPDGSGQRLLAREAFSPAWSPGGTRIAFSRGGDPWVMARDGSSAKRVTDLRSAQYDIAWSPDGRWLVTTPIDRGDVMLVRADGSETRPLTRESGWFHGSPSWQRAPLQP